jgi:RNA-binding protein YlmH
MISKSTASILPGQVVSVRGHGRFVFDGEDGRTKKEKIHLSLRVYQ